MKRVLLLNNVPAPYFDPLFEKLGEESGWQLTVCYSSDWNKDVGWADRPLAEKPAHRTVILDQQHPALKSKLGASIAAAFALAKILMRERPDYLICYGYTLAPQMTLLLWAMMTATPFALIGDANYYNDVAAGLKRLVKGAWLRLLTRRAAALIAIGTANRRFWESHGAKADKLFEARFAVDNDFYERAREERKEEAARLRSQLGLTGETVFLFVGRLVRRKNVDLIIRAARQLNDDRIAIVIAGSGEEKLALEELADGDPRIVFAGNVPPDELPLYYAISNVLVLPATQEPWGLVINEAMASGLAVIAHRHCGAALDLVAPDNGVALETSSVDELARAMRLIASDRSLLHSMQACSQAKIRGWSIDAAARGIIRAVDRSVARGVNRLAASELEREK
ncbi:MAG: glycosyltransferase family 4 protein [Blastocatellia bacterium]